jgi:hypothetical protein
MLSCLTKLKHNPALHGVERPRTLNEQRQDNPSAARGPRLAAPGGTAQCGESWRTIARLSTR